MIPILRTLPAVLAALALGAHFLRRGNLLLVIACLALAVLGFVRRPIARWIVRLSLAAGVVIWCATAWTLWQSRMAAGAPYLRMLFILAGVAAFTAFAAWILPGPKRRPYSQISETE